TAADLEQELAVPGELDDPVVPTTVAVRHPDVPVRSDRNSGRPVEVVGAVPGDPGFPQRHHHVPLLVELEDLMPQPPLETFHFTRIPGGRALGHPEVAFVVEMEAMGKGEHPATE